MGTINSDKDFQDEANFNLPEVESVGTHKEKPLSAIEEPLDKDFEEVVIEAEINAERTGDNANNPAEEGISSMEETSEEAQKTIVLGAVLEAVKTLTDKSKKVLMEQKEGLDIPEKISIDDLVALKGGDLAFRRTVLDKMGIELKDLNYFATSLSELQPAELGTVLEAGRFFEEGKDEKGNADHTLASASQVQEEHLIKDKKLKKLEKKENKHKKEEKNKKDKMNLVKSEEKDKTGRPDTDESKKKKKKKDKEKSTFVDREEIVEYANSNKLCSLVKRDFLNNYMEHYQRLITKPKWVCRKCGRVANEKKSLCKPDPME